MKTIFIATDFSNAAHNAAKYGLQLAKALKAKIILFNAYKVPTPAPSIEVGVSRYDIMVQTEQRLRDEAALLGHDKTTMEITCDEAATDNTIVSIANEKKSDFIICGMKGSGKNIRKVFGSTATSLVKNSNIPVIIVPEPAKFTKPATIVFASDLGLDTDIHAIHDLNNITQLFQSKLYVVTVLKNKNEERLEVLNTPQTKQSTQGFMPTFEYPVGTDVTHALDKFIETHHADMLVMMPHKHDWIERLFKKSETKEMIFHTEIPLLILPEKRYRNNQKK